MAAIEPDEPARGVVFTTTRWSIVLAAGGHESPEAAAALESLCQDYWYPLYSFLRWKGVDLHDAEDLVQGFFERLLSKEYLHVVDPRKGRFRSFLLASIQNFMANEWRSLRTQKRGGKVNFISLDDPTIIEKEMSTDKGSSPEHHFDRQWALTLLKLVLGKLEKEYHDSGRGALFNELKPFLTCDKPEETYAEIAARIETTTDAFKTHVSRIRARYAELLRAEVANTLSDPKLVDEELNALQNLFN
jgi:RNA polymerase sigma factor (sigma-70 family)